MTKIVYFEEDGEYGELLVELLAAEGCQVERVRTVKEGLQMIDQEQFDLVITGVHVQDLSGFHICELIKRRNPQLKIVIVTSSTDDWDEVKAFDFGVDEYIRTTSSFKIVMKRIERVLHSRNQNAYYRKLESQKEDVVVDLDLHIAYKNGESLPLTVIEYDLLVCFLKNKNKPLSREDILKLVWRSEARAVHVDVRSVDTYVKRLREKANIHTIYSVRGIGYRWQEQ